MNIFPTICFRHRGSAQIRRRANLTALNANARVERLERLFLDSMHRPVYTLRQRRHLTILNIAVKKNSVVFFYGEIIQCLHAQSVAAFITQSVDFTALNKLFCFVHVRKNTMYSCSKILLNVDCFAMSSVTRSQNVVAHPLYKRIPVTTSSESERESV